MTVDTTAPSYWLNWRFLLCAIWMLIAMVVSALLIWKYEGLRKSRTEGRDDQRETAGFLNGDEAWKTCLKVIHPGWLLAYRMIAFTMLLGLLIANIVVDGGDIFFFYTQWTFALVTIYFGVGTLFSIYGCCLSSKIDAGERDHVSLDAEQGTYVAPFQENANTSSVPKSSNTNGLEHPRVHNSASIWCYMFQILYQTCAGAVMLTDCVFWFVIYPFLTNKDYKLDFLTVCMHSVNAVFLLGDVILNCLRFPYFRVAYFVLLTVIFVIFQWIIHACVSIWWPYPFLDLSSPYAPAWYLSVGLLQLLCFGIFALIVRTKLCLFRRSFPES